MKKLRYIFALVGVLAVSSATILFWNIQNSQGVSYTWDNGGGDGLWSTCTNWSSDTCPTASDIAVFNPAVSDTSSTIDAGVTFGGSVAGIDIMSGFTGTITQARTLTVGSSAFTQAGGTFTGASQTIDINGAMSLTGGTFTSTSGTLTLSGALTIGAGNTFNHNSGTFTFDGAGDRTIDLDTSETFNAVTINMSAATDDVVITSGDTIIATGTLTLTNGQISTGTLEAQGATITKAATWDGGTGILLITQNTVRNITWTSGPISGLTLNASSTTITINAGSVFTYEGNLTVTSGTITHAGSTSNTTLQGTFLVNGGTYVATPELTSFSTSTDRNWGVTSGTFTHSNGTVWLSVSSGDLTVQGSTSFYDVAVSSTNESSSIFLPAGQTQTIEHLGWFLASNASLPETVRIPIESTSAGSQANIDIQNSAAFASVSLKDINNTGLSAACAAQCDDRGNNTGIDFSGSIGVTVANPIGTTSEAGGTTTFAVVLDSEPQSNVTVPITSTDTTEGTVSSATLTFTNGNWDTPQEVTMTGVDDSTNDGDISYTVTVGSTTSSDSNYSGINPSDVTVTNTDDDTATDTIEFENTADFTFEDVKDSTGTPITFYQHSFGGQGTLMTANGGAVVDITNSRIKEGCIVRISGVDYNLIKVTDEPTYGYNITISRADLTQTGLEDELFAADGTVNSIRCIELASGAAKLNDAFINYERATINGSWMTYDSGNDKLWTTNFLGFSTLSSYSLGTQTVDDYVSDGDTDYPAYDTENDRIWVTNQSSDTITVFDAATGDYAFGGSLVASTFALGDRPLIAEYDSENDAIWVSLAGSAEDTVFKLSATDGSTIGEYTVGGRNYGLARDTLRDEMWVVTYCTTGGMCVVILDATTGAYANGTLANSTFAVPYTNVDTMIEYDPVSDAMWILDEVPSTTKGYVYKIDAATVTAETAAFTGGGGLELIYNSATNEMWTANDNVGTFSAVNATTGREIREYQSVDCPYGIAFDGVGDIWGTDCANGTIDHMVRNGSPTDEYYTIASTDLTQLDVSAVTSIDAAAITETLNTQSIFYTASFDDRHTFVVNGSLREIASDEAAVHGGVDGDWYYRDNGNIWTAAPSNTAEEAISLAVAGGANNQMSGAETEALSSADWETIGFNPGTTTTLDIAATLFTNDVKETPTLGSITFTFTTGGGGGGSGGDGTDSITPSDIAIEVPACSPDLDIPVTMSGEDIDDYILSEDSDFLDASWLPFSSNPLTVNFEVSSGDGVKTIHANFRSTTGNQTGTLTFTATVDETTQCAGIIEPEPSPEPGEETETMIGCENIPVPVLSIEDRERYRLGVSPMGGEYVPASLIFAGDLMRSQNFDTVYCITEDLTRRPYMDEISYFTTFRTFTTVKWVADSTLAEFDIAPPMLPKEDVALVKFETDESVYYFSQDPLDPTHGILRWITTEELARYIAGDNWSDYVIDLNPTLFTRFDVEAPFLTLEDVLADGIDVDEFRKRQLLNENSSTEIDEGVTSTFEEQFRGDVTAAVEFVKTPQGFKSTIKSLLGGF